MSKRFGRNQRRKMRESIDVLSGLALTATAELAEKEAQLRETQAALSEILEAEYRMADGEEAFVIPEANVRRSTDTTDYSRNDGYAEIRRTASVELMTFTMTDKIMEELDRHTRMTRDFVSFRGIRWAVTSIDAAPTEFIGGGMAFTVNLVAIARPRRV